MIVSGCPMKHFDVSDVSRILQLSIINRSPLQTYVTPGSISCAEAIAAENKTIAAANASHPARTLISKPHTSTKRWHDQKWHKQNARGGTDTRAGREARQKRAGRVCSYELSVATSERTFARKAFC